MHDLSGGKLNHSAFKDLIHGNIPFSYWNTSIIHFIHWGSLRFNFLISQIIFIKRGNAHISQANLICVSLPFTALPALKTHLLWIWMFCRARLSPVGPLYCVRARGKPAGLGGGCTSSLPFVLMSPLGFPIHADFTCGTLCLYIIIFLLRLDN